LHVAGSSGFGRRKPWSMLRPIISGRSFEASVAPTTPTSRSRRSIRHVTSPDVLLAIPAYQTICQGGGGGAAARPIAGRISRPGTYITGWSPSRISRLALPHLPSQEPVSRISCVIENLRFAVPARLVISLTASRRSGSLQPRSDRAARAILNARVHLGDDGTRPRPQPVLCEQRQLEIGMRFAGEPDLSSAGRADIRHFSLARPPA